MVDLNEIADRVWTARSEWHGVNATLVAGERGLVVVDTHGSAADGRALGEAVRELDAGELVAVVYTHWHADHVLGTQGLLESMASRGVPVISHETAAQELADLLPAEQERLAGSTDARDLAAAAATLVAPTEVLSSARVLDLGGRTLELLHPGRGHTGGDLVVRVPEVDVLVVGDLLEESAPPSYGPDSFPLEWPLAVDFVMQVMTPRSTIVPGHGTTVDLDFVTGQRGALGQVAETVRDLAGRGIPLAEALGAAEWPWPAETVQHALTRGYEQLPRSQRRLPLI